MASRPLVSICCLAYNHEKTIAQTIEGVLHQKTDFAVELIIHDDASKDKTPEIIRKYAEKYPGVIKAIFQKENQFHQCNLIKTYVYPQMQGTYIALCEGDDYWTDPLKLTRQVQLMREHPKCTMCFHAVEQLNSDGSKVPVYPVKKTGLVSSEQVIRRGGLFCPSVSILLRRDVMDCWPDFRDLADIFDYPTQVLAAHMGEVYYIHRIMAVYRFESEGSWTSAHSKKPDWEHLANEIKWMESFDRYSDFRFHNAITSHFARYCLNRHMTFLNEETRKTAKEWILQLKGLERLEYLSIYYFLQLAGPLARSIGYKVKQISKSRK